MCLNKITPYLVPRLTGNKWYSMNFRGWHFTQGLIWLSSFKRQGCIRPPCPQGHGQGGFLLRKEIYGRYQSLATFIFSKMKWKTWETDKSYLCLSQQVKRGYLNSTNSSFKLTHGSSKRHLNISTTFLKILKFFEFSIEDLRASVRMKITKMA